MGTTILPGDNHIILYTDGSCLGNPGVGGWAYVMLKNHEGKLKKRIQSGNHVSTTNNRMELTAVIQGLTWLIDHGYPTVDVYTDSRYVCDAVNKRWLNSWQFGGWKTSSGSMVKNKDLWLILIDLLAKIRVRFTWVKGHAESKYNVMCDAFARQSAAELL